MVNPSLHSFRHTIDVRLDDLDELGHVNNVVYLRYFEDVARAHADSVGMTFETLQRIGVVPVVRRHDVRYLRSARARDRLEISTRVERGKGLRWLRHNEARRMGELLVQGETEWVWIDLPTGRPVHPASDVLTAFGFAG